MRSIGTPISSRQMASVSESCSYTLIQTRSGARPNSTVASSHAHLRSPGSAHAPRHARESHVLDGVTLEIVAEAEVAEHLEERVVPLGDAHVLNVVCAHALLRGRGPRNRRRRRLHEARSASGAGDAWLAHATRACPRKMGLNCSMPAMVSSTVGSSGTSDELGKTAWPRAAKKSCNAESHNPVSARRGSDERAASAHQEAASDGVTRRILRDARLNRARGAAGAGVRCTRHSAARTAELCVLANVRDSRPQGARSEPAPRFGGARQGRAETARALHAPAASLQTERRERQEGVHRRAAQPLHDAELSCSFQASAAGGAALRGAPDRQCSPLLLTRRSRRACRASAAGAEGMGRGERVDRSGC